MSADFYQSVLDLIKPQDIVCNRRPHQDHLLHLTENSEQIFTNWKLCAGHTLIIIGCV